jgi:hypothetical protein
VSLPAAVELALVVVAFAGGYALARRTRADAALRSLSPWRQVAVGAVAIAPIAVEEHLAVGPVDGIVVGFAASMLAWATLPVLLARDRASTDRAETC